MTSAGRSGVIGGASAAQLANDTRNLSGEPGRRVRQPRKIFSPLGVAAGGGGASGGRDVGTSAAAATGKKRKKAQPWTSAKKRMQSNFKKISTKLAAMEKVIDSLDPELEFEIDSRLKRRAFKSVKDNIGKVIAIAEESVKIDANA